MTWEVFEPPSFSSPDGAALSGLAGAVTTATDDDVGQLLSTFSFSSTVRWRTHQTWGAVTQTDDYSLTQDSVSDLMIVFMLAIQSRCASQVVHSTVCCMQSICWSADRSWRP